MILRVARIYRKGSLNDWIMPHRTSSDVVYDNGWLWALYGVTDYYTTATTAEDLLLIH